jgi:uncharacterized protein
VSGPCLTIVFAKAPLAGFAKTRLIPALGAVGTAELAKRMLRHALQQALAARLGPVELCCAPDAGHAGFREFAVLPDIQLSDQGEGDLGQRMARALERGLRQHAKVLLIGSDAPALDGAVLASAATALDTRDAAFVPALDGGYVLVGLRKQIAALAPGALPGIFDAVPWSTPQVMQCTRERLARQGIGHAELAALADIDEAADLQHLPPGWL